MQLFKSFFLHQNIVQLCTSFLCCSASGGATQHFLLRLEDKGCAEPKSIQKRWASHKGEEGVRLAYSGAYRGLTGDIIHYFTLMSSELHYLDIISKIEIYINVLNIVK